MFPKYVMIKQNFPAEKTDNLESAVRNAIRNSGVDLSSISGKRIGIATGSRGISNIPLIVKTIADVVKENGGVPVVFAAMGSHGNGKAAGQREVLASLGITEDAVGYKIETCAESRFLGINENGMKVFVNELAFSYDKIILVNRIKQHTDFEDITESGILKLMAIGLGNPAGARTVHTHAINLTYGEAIRSTALFQMKYLDILMAVAVTENWQHEINYIEAFPASKILEREAEILKKVKSSTIRLPAEKFDTLIIQQAGKQFSGTCVDTRVVGRIYISGQPEPEYPKIHTIAALDFTEESHGNAMGCGVIDLITRKFFSKIDIDATSLTGKTSSCLLQAKIPCVADNDADAVESAYIGAGFTEFDNIKAMVIPNTSELTYCAVTLSLYDDIRHDASVELISEPFELQYNSDGELILDFPKEH